MDVLGLANTAELPSELDAFREQMREQITIVLDSDKSYETKKQVIAKLAIESTAVLTRFKNERKHGTGVMGKLRQWLANPFAKIAAGSVSAITSILSPIPLSLGAPALFTGGVRMVVEGIRQLMGGEGAKRRDLDAAHRQYRHQIDADLDRMLMNHETTPADRAKFLTEFVDGTYSRELDKVFSAENGLDNAAAARAKWQNGLPAKGAFLALSGAMPMDIDGIPHALGLMKEGSFASHFVLGFNNFWNGNGWGNVGLLQGDKLVNLASLGANIGAGHLGKLGAQWLMGTGDQSPVTLRGTPPRPAQATMPNQHARPNDSQPQPHSNPVAPAGRRTGFGMSVLEAERQSDSTRSIPPLPNVPLPTPWPAIPIPPPPLPEKPSVVPPISIPPSEEIPKEEDSKSDTEANAEADPTTTDYWLSEINDALSAAQNASNAEIDQDIVNFVEVGQVGHPSTVFASREDDQPTWLAQTQGSLAAFLATLLWLQRERNKTAFSADEITETHTNNQRLGFYLQRFSQAMRSLPNYDTLGDEVEQRLQTWNRALQASSEWVAGLVPEPEPTNEPTKNEELDALAVDHAALAEQAKDMTTERLSELLEQLEMERKRVEADKHTPKLSDLLLGITLALEWLNRFKKTQADKPAADQKTYNDAYRHYGLLELYLGDYVRGVQNHPGFSATNPIAEQLNRYEQVKNEHEQWLAHLTVEPTPDPNQVPPANPDDTSKPVDPEPPVDDSGPPKTDTPDPSIVNPEPTPEPEATNHPAWFQELVDSQTPADRRATFLGLIASDRLTELEPNDNQRFENELRELIGQKKLLVQVGAGDQTYTLTEFLQIQTEHVAPALAPIPRSELASFLQEKERFQTIITELDRLQVSYDQGEFDAWRKALEARTAGFDSNAFKKQLELWRSYPVKTSEEIQESLPKIAALPFAFTGKDVDSDMIKRAIKEFISGRNGAALQIKILGLYRQIFEETKQVYERWNHIGITTDFAKSKLREVIDAIDNKIKEIDRFTIRNVSLFVQFKDNDNALTKSEKLEEILRQLPVEVTVQP